MNGGGWLGRRLRDEWRRQPAVALAVAMTFAIAALLCGGDRLFALAAAQVAPAQPPRAELLVYLRDDLGAAAERALVRALGRLSGVREVREVDAAQALARMRQQLGPRGRLLDGAEDGLLPASLEVALVVEPAATLGTRARLLGERLRPLAGVMDVELVEPAAPPLAGRPVASIRPLAAGLLALSGLATLGALSGMVVAARARRRDEIKLLLALGFTRGAAFLPAVLAAVMASVGGAALGLGALRFGARFLGATPQLGWRALSPVECACGLAAATLLGGLVGYLMVRAPDSVDVV